jgi:hypothetical protein
MRAALSRSHELGHEIVACAVLVPDPMPDWSTDEILAVHFRMHKAEGVLFPDVLVRGAAAQCMTPPRSPDTAQLPINQYTWRTLGARAKSEVISSYSY